MPRQRATGDDAAGGGGGAGAVTDRTSFSMDEDGDYVRRRELVDMEMV